MRATCTIRVLFKACGGSLTQTERIKAMTKRIKKAAVVAFALLFATTSLYTAPTALAGEEKPEEGSAVHANIETFQKNYELTIDQKKEAIDTIERAVATVTDTDMSDLEKYYRLALWENDRATYDNEFWSGRYYMEHYRHQWDAYGVLFDKSVCAGIAITYACLCHAAGLPCKFVRLYPEKLDHTINYIPNINGNSYYMDVTEALMFMSKETNPWGDDVDKDFAHIKQECTSHCFEYREKPDPFDEPGKDDVIQDKDDDTPKKDYRDKIEEEKKEEGTESFFTLGLKDCFKTTYYNWYNEYALHKNTDKDFVEPYVELGSGKRGVNYAKYSEYPTQFSDTEKPGLWFLEDFYKDPKLMEYKIRNKELDEQLVNLKGIEGGFEADNAKELEGVLRNTIFAEYYPSVNEKTGEIVTEDEYLTDEMEFTLKCDSFDKAKHKAKVTMTGKGDYKGSLQFTVKLKYDNPMKASGKTVTIKRGKLKKKAQTIGHAKAISVTKAMGGAEFKLVSAKKGTKNFKKSFKINPETGDVTVAKGLKKGTYKVKAKVRAWGNDNYKMSGWKTVTIKVKVK